VAADGRERWEKTMAVNVQGPFNVTMAFVEQLKLTRGTIVNIASINSYVAQAGSGAYPVSKGAWRSSRARSPPSWRPTACGSTHWRPASSPPP
jgi:NAD(P)-dependent dehydrogenase (short-subunit alcohol dehydrogenase family)